ncbi:hypothetical protein BDFB_005926 [Asbolus verrucosus]|uniref:Uncharacterized protein n=1 Tax=Asbolus verrucosus TaxID=1661398 RepID=A0A482VV25_ASBVE|nr:hypothetical protein BDFB_005926 [Asbolus verrucosus]
MSSKWSPKTPQWSREEQELLPAQINGPSPVPLKTILEKSDAFPRKFPVDSGRCKTLKAFVPEDTLERNANSAYPIVHANILHFYAQFILHKRKYGNAIEKAVYKDMDVLQLIDRFLKKRAATFMGKRDFYTLLDGKKGSQSWESIGTPQEKEPLLLKNCLSYEEVKLSAFLSVSSYTYFVNIGDRKNLAVYKAERDGIEDEGIIIGIIGPRLIKEGVMEYQELVITEKQNNKENGYGKIKPPTIHHLFAKLYEEGCWEYKEILENRKSQPARYTNLTKGEILDDLVYYKRLVFTMDTLFLEANQRALERNTTAYIHVVGIGLGVWKKSPCQNKLFMDACGERIKLLGKQLHNVSDICFAYIAHDSCLNYKHGDTIPIDGHPLKGIKIYLCKREPHSKLTGRDRGKLLVVSYAWDGNALPGNEFWNKKLGSSGDSAAASSTQISELHNPFINPRVCASNLKVAVGGKVIGIEEYARNAKTGEKRKLGE